jgi:hypothetical protein
MGYLPTGLILCFLYCVEVARKYVTDRRECSIGERQNVFALMHCLGCWMGRPTYRSEEKMPGPIKTPAGSALTEG